MGYQWSDLQWALSVLHSRCFTRGSPALHLTAPGIDMANHTFTPNATVRYASLPVTGSAAKQRHSCLRVAHVRLQRRGEASCKRCAVPHLLRGRLCHWAWHIMSAVIGMQDMA